MKNILSAITAIFLTTQAMATIEIQWVEQAAPTEYRPAVRADFTTADVLTHAGTFAENYDMDFLNSAAGQAVVSTVIAQINNNKMPKKDIVGLFSRWNASKPSAGYNKSVVAHYVSVLKK